MVIIRLMLNTLINIKYSITLISLVCGVTDTPVNNT